MEFRDKLANVDTNSEMFIRERKKQFIPQGAVVYLTDECLEIISRLGQHIQAGQDRPWVIVSNNMNNKYSPNVVIASMTTSRSKVNIPTHVEVPSVSGSSTISTVLCEMPITIGKENIKRIRHITLTDENIEDVSRALNVQVGIINRGVVKGNERSEFRKSTPVNRRS